MTDELPLPDSLYFESEAFPGLEFFLTGTKDAITLYASKTSDPSGSALQSLITLDRQGGSITRHPVPADYPHLSGRGSRLLLPLTEEIANPRAAQAVVDSPAEGTTVPLCTPHGTLLLRLRKPEEEDDVLIEVGQVVTQVSEARRTVWSALALISPNGSLILFDLPSIPGIRRHPRTHYILTNNREDGRDRQSVLTHPLDPTLNFALQSGTRDIYLTCNGRHIAKINADKQMEILSPPFLMPPIIPRGPDGGWAVHRDSYRNQYCVLNRVGGEQLPPEAKTFSPLPGIWNLRTLKDGRRKYKWIKDLPPNMYFMDPKETGTTSFLLPPIAGAERATTEPAAAPIP